MASKKDSKGSSYLKVSKGQTTLHIPEPLPSDSTDNTVDTLFNEENELGPTTKYDSMSDSTVTLPVPVSYKKTPKRKLELEFESLSQTTPRRKSENFSQLISFWENKSGGKSTTKSSTSDKSSDVEKCEIYESPIDNTVKNFANSVKSVKTPLRSAEQITFDYTQLIKSVKTDVVKPQNESNDDVIDNVYDFNDTDIPVERMSLAEFRQTECESPMKEVAKTDLKSPIMFDTKKFIVKKLKTPLTSNLVNATDVSLESHSAKNILHKSDIMPPPSTIPKCLSAKKHATPSPGNTRELSVTAPKLRQKLFEDSEFSPNDLTSPSPEIGKKRKRRSFKRLLSMEPSNYSLLFTPPNKDISDSDHKFSKSSSVSVTVEMNGEISMDFESSVDVDSDVWTESQSEVSLSDISAITPVHNKTNIEINEPSKMVNLETKSKTSETREVDSFFDMTLNTPVVDNSVVDIENISAIGSGNKEVMNCSEICTPEIIKGSGGRKRQILEKLHTTLNDSLICDSDNSADAYSINAEVANVVGAVVGNYFGSDESCTDDASLNMNAVCHSNKEQVLESCGDSRMNETFPELCNHAVSVAELRAVIDENVDVNNNSFDIPSPETSEVSADTDPETDNSFSTEYEYDLNLSYPPPLQIDLSRLEDMDPQSRSTIVEVTENINYESGGDILDLDNLESKESCIEYVPETLKTLCAKRLVKCRSSVYNELLTVKATCSSSYLSVPLHVDVSNNESLTSHIVAFDLENDKDPGSVEFKGLMDPCYSPELTCSESSLLSTNSSNLSSRNIQCWSPVLSNAEIKSEYTESDHDSDSTTDTNDGDAVNKYHCIVTQKRNLKRPRCLKFDNPDYSSDVYTPSPKLPKTPLTIKHFEFPDTNEIDEGAQRIGNRLIDNEISDDYEYGSESEMRTLAEIDENNLLDQSCLSDSEYPESLNSSTAYCESFKFWSPASSVSTHCQWSPTSSSSNDETSGYEDDKVSFVSSELETYPVYTQDGPTYPVYTQDGPTYLQSLPDVPTSPSEFSEPLDLSVTVENNDCEKEIKVNEIETVVTESAIGNGTGHSNEMLDLYEPICISEPCVATLEQNSSNVWKEIDIGNVSYSYEPSAKSTQYANDCFNNAVYGASDSQVRSIYEPRYVATALYPNPAYSAQNESAFMNIDQSGRDDSNHSVPMIEGLTVPIHILNDPSAAVPAVYGVTIPLQNSSPSINCEQVPLNESFLYSQNSSSQNQCERRQSVDGLEKLNACYYGDKNSHSIYSADGYESTGNTAGSSNSDSEDDLVKMIDNSVRNKLKKKVGSSFISPSDDSFELSDTLKNVRPYVISGWISSTYLMALAKKPDLVNDMLDNALNENGEIHDWIVESCRNTTPAVLARDLVFRLFTLEELENLNLISLARKKRFKAIKKCIEKKFPQKLTRRIWNVSCLGLIKSSVTTLFKHRVKHVQNFLVMHGACG